MSDFKPSNVKDEIFQDGSGHKSCGKCGYCIPCGDCDKYGCGSKAKEANK